jgi:DNA-binding response OmpR family regulator
MKRVTHILTVLAVIPVIVAFYMLIYSIFPIIFITAHDDEQVQVRAFQEGAIAFLLKPFSSEELLRAVHLGLKSDS